MKLTPLQQTEGITVLSLFDGMSCGQLALQRAGIKVKAYYAAEIDKHAIKVTQHNFPGTIQLGDVTQVTAATLPKIDLLIGGSPCQGFSFAGKKLNFEDPRSKLFFEYVRLLKECKPTWFLLENVRMEYAHELVISQYLGTSPVKINSSLFSAQSRLRLYWTNINQITYGLFNDRATYIPLPPDKGILLKHILQTDVPKKYFLNSKTLMRALRRNYSKPQLNPDKTGAITASNNSADVCLDSGTTFITDTNGKTGTALDAHYYKGFGVRGNKGRTVIQDDFQIIVHNLQPRSGDPKKGGTGPLSRNDGKTYCLDTGQTNAIELPENIRRLTPVECERLQTVPDNYTAPVSDTQRYRMLGNGWTVDVVAYIFSFILKPTKP